MKEDRGKTGIEIGVVVTMMLFLMTLTFNAGIQYGQQVDMRRAIDYNSTRIATIINNEATKSERLGRIEALMSDIKEELGAQKKP